MPVHPHYACRFSFHIGLSEVERQSRFRLGITYACRIDLGRSRQLTGSPLPAQFQRLVDLKGGFQPVEAGEGTRAGEVFRKDTNGRIRNSSGLLGQFLGASDLGLDRSQAGDAASA